jgi:hypothetical protein
MTPVPIERPEQYQAKRQHIFPSIASWLWFSRKHRRALLAGRALSKPTGRLMVNPEAFDRVVIEVGYAALGEAP